MAQILKNMLNIVIGLSINFSAMLATEWRIYCLGRSFCALSVSSPHPVGPGLRVIKPQPVFIANYRKDLGAGAVVTSALIRENAQDLHYLLLGRLFVAAHLFHLLAGSIA